MPTPVFCSVVSRVPADAAALAGVVALPANTGTLDTTEQNTVVGEARSYAQKNMSLANHGNIVATSDVKPGHWEPDTRTFYALSDIPTGENADAVKVIARRAQVNDNPLDLFFAGVIGFNQTDVTAKAIAYAGPGSGEACILSLDPTLDGAIEMSGTNVLDLGGCGIALHSTSDKGFKISGTSSLSAGEVCMAGGPGIEQSGTVTWVPSPADLQANCDPPADPLATLAAPVVDAGCDAAHTDRVFNTAGAIEVLAPGTYCGGLEFSGNNMAITLLPGNYVLKGGGLKISGNNISIAGTGIMFYNTDDAGSYGNFDFSGSSNTINFTAPTTGEYAGVLFFGDRTSTSGQFLWKIAGGNNTVNMDGVIYAPSQLVEFSGNSVIGGPCGVKVISKTIKLNGNSNTYPSPGNDCASDNVGIPLGTQFVLVD